VLKKKVSCRYKVFNTHPFFFTFMDASAEVVKIMSSAAGGVRCDVR
jgi:hypothetical protein